MIETLDARADYGGADMLTGITTRFIKGGFTCVIGPNGGGKSTLLRALSGVARYRGHIALDSRELREIPGRTRARRVAYMPQTRPVPMMRVREMLESARFPYAEGKTATAKAVERAAELAGVACFMDSRVSELSGGERQRAYFAMLLVQDAEVMLLDEPAAHLDLPYQLELMRVLENLRQMGKTVIMAEHDLPRALTYATDIKIIADGSIIKEGAPANIYRCAEMRETFGAILAPSTAPGSVYAYDLVRG